MISCIHTHCIHNKDACCTLDTVTKLTNATTQDIRCLYYESKADKKENKPSTSS